MEVKKGSQLQHIESTTGKPNELKVVSATKLKGDAHGSVSSKRSSGVQVVDVLPAVVPCTIGSISLKNFYTAFLTIRVKIRNEVEKGGVKKDDGKWKTCLHQYQLMPNPHCETGSQDFFTISHKKMLFTPKDVTAVRFILQQPSPVWNSFKIENISLSSDKSEEDTSNSHVLTWLQEQNEISEETAEPQKESDRTTKEIAEHMQRLWALTETVQLQQQTQSSLGRFDVDGSYEINLLSYT